MQNQCKTKANAKLLWTLNYADMSEGEKLHGSLLERGSSPGIAAEDFEEAQDDLILVSCFLPCVTL